MEHLTKQQVVLTCILVALVTSVATAITVVSLSDETGLPTQTIYRVIETTIDKVADIPDTKDTKSDVKETPKPAAQVLPSDIAQMGAKSLVRIYDTTNGEKSFAALAVAIGDKDGVVASTPSALVGTSYTAVLSDGSEAGASFVKDLGNGFSYFKLAYQAGSKYKAPALDLKGLSAVKLGANVVAVGGKESGNVVSLGIVSEVKDKEGDTPASVITDMSLSSLISGFLLFDTSGNLVALEQKTSPGQASFIDASYIKSTLAGL